MPGRGEHGEQDRHHDEVGLHAEHQPATVERVGQHAGRQGQQHHRQRAGGLHQGDDGGRVRVVRRTATARRRSAPTTPTLLTTTPSQSQKNARCRNGAHGDTGADGWVSTLETLAARGGSMQ